MPSLIWQDAPCQGAIKPVWHNYWTCALEPGSRKYWGHVLQLLKPTCPRTRALQQEQPPPREACVPPLRRSPHSPQLEKSLSSNSDPAQPKMQWKKSNFYLLREAWTCSTCHFEDSLLHWSRFSFIVVATAGQRNMCLWGVVLIIEHLSNSMSVSNFSHTCFQWMGVYQATA